MLRNNHGITLVEMLVVLVLSSIIMAASYRVFIGEQKVYTVQDQVTDMQQNAKAALDRMNREIRMAGYEKEILESLGNITGFTKIITPRNNGNNIGKNDDQITIIIADKAITYRLQWDATDPGMPVLVRIENGVSEMMADNIERYLSGFSKVVRFYSRGYSLPEIRELADMSERLIQEYLDLYEIFKDRPESQIRFQQIRS